MRIVFMGTPTFSCPSLVAVHDAGHEVAAVVTRRDKPAGRGRTLTPPPVKTTAAALGLPVYQPPRVNHGEFIEVLSPLQPDAVVVVAFGAILKIPLLRLGRLGAVNVHASLLPAYRGVAPANWSLIHGNRITGVTTMLMDEGVDTGPTLMQQPMEVSAHETAGEVLERMSRTGAELLVDTLAGLESGSVQPRAQSEQGQSYAPRLEKVHGYLDLGQSAEAVFNQFRGVTPVPGARLFLDGSPMLVSAMRPITEIQGDAYVILEVGSRHVRLGTGAGAVDLLQVRPAGKADMEAGAFAHGRRLQVGDRFAAPPEIPDLSLRDVVPQ